MEIEQKMLPLELKGIIGIPLTSFNAANEFDPGPFKEQVDFFVRRKAVDMLAYPMHVSEALEMSDVERKKALETVINHSNGRLPVIAHVSSPGTDNAVGFARHARDAGADAALVVNPYYNRPSQAGLLAHVRAILAGAPGLPLLLSADPSRGFSYYDGLTFEIHGFHSGNQSADTRKRRWVGGGHYRLDTLATRIAATTGLSLPPAVLSGVGMAFDLDNLTGAAR